MSIQFPNVHGKPLNNVPLHRRAENKDEKKDDKYSRIDIHLIEPALRARFATYSKDRQLEICVTILEEKEKTAKEKEKMEKMQKSADGLKRSGNFKDNLHVRVSSASRKKLLDPIKKSNSF